MDKQSRSELIAELRRLKLQQRRTAERYETIRTYMISHNLIGAHDWGTVYEVTETRVRRYTRRGFIAMRVRMPKQ